MRVSLNTLAIIADTGDIQAQDAFHRYSKLRAFNTSSMNVVVYFNLKDSPFSMGLEIERSGVKKNSH